MQELIIYSGGQVGVDRFALDWAIKNNVAHGGWCPLGRRAKDGTIPAYYNLLELSSKNYKIRTRRNVTDSDGTLILTPAKELSGGSALTRNYCIHSNKPYLHLCPGDDRRGKIEMFVENNWIERLNVAGPSNAHEIESFITNVLDEFLCVWGIASKEFQLPI